MRFVALILSSLRSIFAATLAFVNFRGQSRAKSVSPLDVGCVDTRDARPGGDPLVRISPSVRGRSYVQRMPASLTYGDHAHPCAPI